LGKDIVGFLAVIVLAGACATTANIGSARAELSATERKVAARLDTDLKLLMRERSIGMRCAGLLKHNATPTLVDELRPAYDAARQSNLNIKLALVNRYSGPGERLNSSYTNPTEY
jgi:hypothetical protein